MINCLAICLVLSSLSASGFWSPSSGKHQKESRYVIAGDGHRVLVVVEDGDQAQHNTRVSTSDRRGSVSASDEEKRLSASNYPPTTTNGVEGADNDVHGLKEFICDALGKCKHKMSNAVGEVKEMASHQAKEAGLVKAEDVEEKAKETIRKVKDKVSEKTSVLKDRVKETAGKGIERMKEAKDIGKTIRHDMATNLSETVETTEEEANVKGKETTKKTIKHVADRVRAESHKAINALFQGGRKLAILTTTFTAAPALARMSLFGVAIAFGMGVWVTFLSS